MTCREKILSNDYADIVTDFMLPEALRNALPDACRVPLQGDFSVIYAEIAGLPPINVSEYAYHFIPQCYGLMMDGGNLPNSSAFDILPLLHSGISQVQRPPLSLTGRGVVMAFLDTGIRYREAVFRREDGGSRILAAWDQTNQEGNPPEGILYGTEYSREQIDEALQTDNPFGTVPLTDENGHGTAIASVAAGSRLSGGQEFLGAAPDCDIVVVKLRQAKQYLREYYRIPESADAYAESDILMALDYVDRFAEAIRRPVVICFALGTNFGTHTGVSILSRYLDVITRKRSRAVVVCGGNEGNAAHHYESNICRGTNGYSENVEIRVTENNRGFITEFWGSLPQTYTLSVRSPSGEVADGGRRGAANYYEHTFLYGNTKLTVSYFLVAPSSGDELIVVRFVDPTPGIWTLQVESTGECVGRGFHVWLPITEFLYSETYFIRPTPYTTMTVPAYGEDRISVSTYNDFNNSFYANSGRGFAKNDEIKPDFAAPGVGISTVLGARTGSGLAAALTAGGVAQFMQWAVVEENMPYVYCRDIKNYLIRGALREPNFVYPNREWGFGRLNMEKTFEQLAGL